MMNTAYQHILISIFLSILLISHAALASTTGGVGSPNVKKDKISTELRFGYSTDDTGSSQNERLRSTFLYDHGLTDHYALRITAATDKRKGNNLEADNIGIENRLHILKEKTHGFDFGIRLNYSHKDGDKKTR